MERPIITILSQNDLTYITAYQNYTSLRWENKSAGPGGFEFHLPFEEKLTCGNIVKITCGVTEPYGVIMYVRLEQNKTVVIGKMLSQLLSYRFPVKDGADISFSTSGGIPELLCMPARYSCKNTKDYFFGKPVTLAPESAQKKDVSYEGSLSESCLDSMISIANDSKAKFAVTIENGVMKISSGSYADCGIILDSALGGFYNESYTTSNDNSRNVFAYSYKNEDGWIYQSYPDQNQPQGAERRVLYIGKFDGTPSYEIRKKRSSLTESDCFEAEIAPLMRQHIFAGGCVNVKKDDWQVDKTFNITSITDVWEESHRCFVTFGDPQPTAYEKIIQRFR